MRARCRRLLQSWAEYLSVVGIKIRLKKGQERLIKNKLWKDVRVI